MVAGPLRGVAKKTAEKIQGWATDKFDTNQGDCESVKAEDVIDWLTTRFGSVPGQAALTQTFHVLRSRLSDIDPKWKATTMFLQTRPLVVAGAQIMRAPHPPIAKFPKRTSPLETRDSIRDSILRVGQDQRL